MKKLLFFISILLLSNNLNSQNAKTPKTEFTKMYLPVWIEAKEHCLNVANTMPEELYSYKPTDVSKTFAEQMVHIAYTLELLTQRYVQGMDVKPNTPDASKMTKAEIIKMLENGFDYTTKIIYSIDPAQLD